MIVLDTHRTHRQDRCVCVLESLRKSTNAKHLYNMGLRRFPSPQSTPPVSSKHTPGLLKAHPRSPQSTPPVSSKHTPGLLKCPRVSPNTPISPRREHPSSGAVPTGAEGRGVALVSYHPPGGRSRSWSRLKPPALHPHLMCFYTHNVCECRLKTSQTISELESRVVVRAYGQLRLPKCPRASPQSPPPQ